MTSERLLSTSRPIEVFVPPPKKLYPPHKKKQISGYAPAGYPSIYVYYRVASSCPESEISYMGENSLAFPLAFGY